MVFFFFFFVFFLVFFGEGGRPDRIRPSDGGKVLRDSCCGGRESVGRGREG